MSFSQFNIQEGSFKSYDVRGKYPQELDESTAYAIAKAFVRLNPCKKVLVGHDHRESTKPLCDALIKGLQDAGVTVVNIGQVTTDMTYFSSWYYSEQGAGNKGIEGTIMVTASHLPADFNGFKMINKELAPVGRGSGMEELFAFAKEVQREESVVERGQVEVLDVFSDYLSFLQSFVDFSSIKPLNVVIDYGNGVAGPIGNKVFSQLAIQSTSLCVEPDAHFPNHEANPIEEKNRHHIMSEVARLGADMGIAFDADADRAYFIDEHGQFIHGDFITALLGLSFVKRFPKTSIVYDVRASNVVMDTISKAGGVAIMERVGHAHIKKTMREHDAAFGGEVSGHYYFKQNHYMDNGFIPALMVLQLVSESGKPLSQLIQELGDYYVSGEINSVVADANAVMERLKDRYKDAKLSYMDGISIEFPDWRCNVRKSNTEPLVRLNLEANSDALMQQKRDEVLQLIRS